MEFLDQSMAALPLGQTTLLHIIVNILAGFLAGLVIATTYRVTHTGFTYTKTFLFSLVFLTVIATLIIIAIGESIARAFALAGALSIIRFRTPIKDTRDITFIFFSLVIGLAMGTGHLVMSLASTFMISGLIILYYRLSTSTLRPREKFLLRLGTEDIPYCIDLVEETTETGKVGADLVNVTKPSGGEIAELTYVLRPEAGVRIDSIIELLSDDDKVSRVSTVPLSDTVDY